MLNIFKTIHWWHLKYSYHLNLYWLLIFVFFFIYIWIFLEEQRQNGAVIFHIIGAIYFFSVSGIVIDRYFIPSVQCICEDLKITPVRQINHFFFSLSFAFLCCYLENFKRKKNTVKTFLLTNKLPTYAGWYDSRQPTVFFSNSVSIITCECMALTYIHTHTKRVQNNEILKIIPDFGLVQMRWLTYVYVFDINYNVLVIYLTACDNKNYT